MTAHPLTLAAAKRAESQPAAWDVEYECNTPDGDACTCHMAHSWDHVSDPRIDGERYFWECTARLVGVIIQRDDGDELYLTRAQAEELFGLEWVRNAQDASAEAAEND